jgi:hypothetical protein
MRRPVEPHISFLCIPAGMQPSMNALDRFAAHQLTMEGMHSAGMQQEGRAVFLPSGASLRDATLPGLFCGSVIGRSYILQADKQKEMTKTTVLARNEATKPSGAARSVRVPAAAVCSVLRPYCIPEGCTAR